jgi:hypothetical protein
MRPSRFATGTGLRDKGNGRPRFRAKRVQGTLAALRFGSMRSAFIAAGVVLLVGAAALSCSSSGFDLGASGGGAYDAGNGDSSDSGVSDSGGDTGPPDAGAVPTAVTFINAGPLDVRLCWTDSNGKLSDVDPPFPSDHPMPASNYPGIPTGGAGMLPDPSKIVGLQTTIYALDARLTAKLESSPSLSCAELACDENSGRNCLGSSNYFVIPSAEPVPSDGSSLVAIAGCPAVALDRTATAARCGANYDASQGNLHVDIVPIAPTTRASPGMLSVQAVQLSAGVQTLLGPTGSAQVAFGTADTTFNDVAPIVHEGDIEPMVPTRVPLDTTLLGAYGDLGFQVDVAGGDAGPAEHLWMSLAEAQSLVSPGMDPRVYFGDTANTYVVVVLGDPSLPHAFDTSGDAGYDGRGLHLLVLDSQNVIH